MRSHLAAMPRRIPCQPRGRRRVAGLLCAAASVIAEMGYEATTMAAIARRARSSIGSLYQFFPNKEAVADSLRSAYVGELKRIWSGLETKAGGSGPAHLARRLVGSQIELARKHPAFLALFEAPPTVNSRRRRAMIRERISGLIRACHAQMGRERASVAAAVVQSVMAALLRLYGRVERSERGAVQREFEALLSAYLSSLSQ